MNGHFVERMAFGADHVKALKKLTRLPLDVHMMVECPEQHLDNILDAGANVFVSGGYLFKGSIEENINALRKGCVQP